MVGLNIERRDAVLGIEMYEYENEESKTATINLGKVRISSCEGGVRDERVERVATDGTSGKKGELGSGDGSERIGLTESTILSVLVLEGRS